MTFRELLPLRSFTAAAMLTFAASFGPAFAEAPLRGMMSVEELRTKLGAPNLVVVDIRSEETRDASAALFAAGHIPGAVHGDYVHASWRLPRNKISVDLPEPAQFEVLAGDLGIDNDSHVVIVHEGHDATSFGAAARVYWTLKSMGHASVAILDGGWRGWTGNPANPVAKGASAPTPAIYEAKPDPRFRASPADVAAASNTRKTTLVDSRPASFFTGLEKHRAIASFGHVTGAVNIPHSSAINADFKLKDAASLAKAFAAAGEGDVITYCNTGHWAATDWFVLSEVLGRPNVRMYEGSMLDYTSEKRGPISNPRVGSGS